MQKKIKHYAKEIGIIFVSVILFSNLLSWYKSQELNHNPLHMSTFFLVDGSSYTPPKNQPLIIHFWATWCPTCKLEADNIARLSKKCEVLTIAVDSKTDAEIQTYLNEHNLHFRVVNDKNKILAQHFKIMGFPTTFIYDKKHNLAFSEVGYTSSLGLYLRMLYASF